MGKSKSKFRVSANDAPERLPDIAPPTGGELPPHRVPVLDQRGQRVGHVSAKTGSAATALRFGIRNAKLTKTADGPAWQGESGAFNQRRAAVKLQQQRTIAKGSVTKSPTKPALAIRPERGG